MMSREEQQPGEEDGEDEEGDIEARTAVEALLALTSPTDYTHHTGYEEDYIMQPVPEDYSEKIESGKETLRVYNEESEPLEVQLEDNSVGVIREPLTMHVANTNVREVREMQVAVCTSGPSLEQHESCVSDTKRQNPPPFTSSVNCRGGDDGLKPLKEFVQVTGGEKDNMIRKLSETDSHAKYVKECDNVYENFHDKSQLTSKEKVQESLREKTAGSISVPVQKACDKSTNRQGDATSSPCVTEKKVSAKAYESVSAARASTESNYKQEIRKVQVPEETFCGFVNTEKGIVGQTRQENKGAISIGPVSSKGNVANIGEVKCSDGSLKKDAQIVCGSNKATSGAVPVNTNVRAEVTSGGADSDDSGDSDTSSGSDSDTSSGSDSSSSDSDSDASDSESDSESDSKSAEESQKQPPNLEKQFENVVKVDVEKSENKERENSNIDNTVKKHVADAVKEEKVIDDKTCQTEVKLKLKELESKSFDLDCKETKPLPDIKKESVNKTVGADNCTASSVEVKASDLNNAEVSRNTTAERKVSNETENGVSSLAVQSNVGKTVKLCDENEKLKNESHDDKKQNSVISKIDTVKENCVLVSEREVSVAKRFPKTCQTTNPSKSNQEKMSEVDLVQQVAVAFAQQLSTIQANQLKNLSEKSRQEEEYLKGYRDDDTDGLNQNSIDEAIEDDKLESEGDDTFPMPIQAEVVMSEGSESGIEYESCERNLPKNDDIDWCKKGTEILDQSEKENIELMAYLKSFVNGGVEGEVIEYPPSNNNPPSEGSDLTQWQLDGVHLPPFTPTVAPPTWLRLTIPAEGYRCNSCGDTFFIESSLVQHRERRSVWISLECGPCDAKLTFYNRCALKDHLHNHLMQGEEVDEETVEVRSLPLQLTRLLQPILVPVPQSLRLASNNLKRKLKGHATVNKLPVLKPVGRSTGKLPEEYHNGSLDDNFEEDENEEFADCGNEDLRVRLSSPDKIPPGMKRLSPRKRTVRCYLCERMFHSVRELMAHMRTDQPYSDQRVECKKCQLVLPSVCAAKAHILTHPPANTSNISVCPECGSRCDGPREFVHHLNTCGHQFRRSGIVCTECQVCFFKSQDDFLTHWIAEHCTKSYECVVCHNTFESLVFHKCTSPGQQVLATFRCLLTCPMCSLAVQLHAQGERDTNTKVRAHLAEAHPTIITRVHYVYKSKFCTNAFRSKDELRAHHDREHRRDNHYRTKTCTLHHEVLGYQHQYFNGQEPRNAFVTLPVALSAEELHEARIRDVPTVSSVIDKTLFPDITPQESTKTVKVEKQVKNKVTNKSSPKEIESKESILKESPAKKDMDQLDKLRPKVCYRCGYKYVDNKDFRRHKRACEGEAAERQCEVCGMVAIGEDFARHCLGHVQDGGILCIYCNGTQFSSSTDLEQHFELHVHEQFSYPASCAFCCTSLPDVPTALAHLNEEHDPLHVPFDTSEFECDRCGRRFHGERGLSVHLGRCTLGTATPTPSSAGCRQCQVCTKALTPEMFGRHLVCHLEEGLLVCSLCDGRTLPSSMALLHHLEEHAAALAYPNSCPMCSFVMQDAASALTHLKEEHGFGNLHCDECDMHFNFTYQLQRHTDIVHKICQYAKRRYICWICRAYDHVKKETLMNHFRTVHGLDREQVDEKVMIRTRGQGTMPTSQFIPTKPLGSKENPGVSSANKSDTDTVLSKAQKEKSKSSSSKTSATELSVKQPINKTSQGSPSKSNPSSPKKVIGRRGDSKLKDKTKVLIKRLPDSILDEQSRSKRRKKHLRNEDVQKDTETNIKKGERKKKRKKAFKCGICTFGTNSKEKLDSHVSKHRELGEEAEPDGFVCRECGASFVVEPSLTRHMFFAHKVKLQVSSADENEDEKNVSELKSKRMVVKEPRTVKDEKGPNSVNEAKVKNIKEEKVKNIKEEKVKNIKEAKVKNIKEEKGKTIKEEKELASNIKEENVTVVKRKVARVSLKKKMEKENIKKKVEVKTKKKAAEGIIKKKVAKAITKKRVEKVVTKKKLEKIAPRKKMIKEVNKRKSEKEILARKAEEGENRKFDNQCVVCKEEFTNPVELYSHLRTHGMAFLKLGRKARPFGIGKPLDR